MENRTSVLLATLGGVSMLAIWYYRNRKSGAAAEPWPENLGEVVISGSRITDPKLLPRGIRNNNPGNIEWISNPAQRWRGMVGRDGRYGVFDTAPNGVRAIGGELRASIRKGQRTVQQIINEWAPPTENNTSAYVRAVAQELGVGEQQEIDVERYIPQLAAAIIRQENSMQPYSMAEITAWVNS